MKYDLRLKTEDITLTDKDGNEKEYILYEATGTQRDIQQKHVYSRQGEDGKVTDIVGIKDHFLGMLLRDKATNAPVGTEFFISVPGRFREQLYEAAQLLCGMQTEAAILKALYNREMQLGIEKVEAEERGEVWTHPDEVEQAKRDKEKAEGKE